MGRLVYLSLDWGLETQVERELSETLEILVCQMTKVNPSISADRSCRPVRALSDVIQVLTSSESSVCALLDRDHAEYAFGLNV